MVCCAAAVRWLRCRLRPVRWAGSTASLQSPHHGSQLGFVGLARCGLDLLGRALHSCGWLRDRCCGLGGRGGRRGGGGGRGAEKFGFEKELRLGDCSSQSTAAWGLIPASAASVRSWVKSAGRKRCLPLTMRWSFRRSMLAGVMSAGAVSSVAGAAGGCGCFWFSGSEAKAGGRGAVCGARSSRSSRSFQFLPVLYGDFCMFLEGITVVGTEKSPCLAPCWAGDCAAIATPNSGCICAAPELLRRRGRR